MNGKINIEVMMSTYNGEKYLREQLDSILSQQGDFNLKISIRDDGSSDSTHDILKQYRKDHAINVTFGKNLGLNASIMELVKSSERDFDYFAFSDQDDVWAEHKLQEAINNCKPLDNNGPVLWSCMEQLTDENLKPYKLMPYPKYFGSFYNAIIQNKAAGHTQVFNRALRDRYKVYPPEQMYVYDWVLYIIATEFGKVYYCGKVCGLYRQHGDNAIGYDTNALKQIKRRAKRLIRGDLKNISAQLHYIYKFYKNGLQEEHRNELERFLTSQKNIFKRIKYILSTKIKRETIFESIQFRILYVLGFYNHRE